MILLPIADGHQNVFCGGRNFDAFDLGECRHPEDNATGEGYAYLTIYDGPDAEGPVFQGWMVASSPALNALDHARYDVWVLRCKTS